MTIYDMANELTEMLFGEKGVNFERLREEIAKQLTMDKMNIPPQYLFLKVTNYCNSNCVYCDHARDKVGREIKGELSTESLKKIISEAAELGVKAMTISGGEPLVRDDIEVIAKMMVDNGIIAALLTNGYYLKQRAKSLYDSGLKYFVISLDSIDEKTFSAQRGIPLAPVMEGIEELIKLKEKDDRIKIHVTPVVTAKNITQMPAMVEYFTAKKIALQFSPYHQFGDEKLEELDSFDREEVCKTVDKLIQMKKEGYLIADSAAFLEHFKNFMCERQVVPEGYHCLVGYTACFGDSLGNVRPCWSGGFNAGNLKEKSLKEIWYSEEYMKIRKEMFNCRCPGCWLLCTGEITMLLNGHK